MIVQKIISGGQTGADQAGLAAAKTLGLKTGGWMPRGWRTDEGPRRDFAELYGLVCDKEWTYPPRTKKNVRDSDCTLIFGKDSPGSRLTIHYCRIFTRPYEVVNPYEISRSKFFRGFLNFYKVTTLNVAGNRERTNPGIYQATYDFLLATL